MRDRGRCPFLAQERWATRWVPQRLAPSIGGIAPPCAAGRNGGQVPSDDRPRPRATAVTVRLGNEMRERTCVDIGCVAAVFRPARRAVGGRMSADCCGGGTNILCPPSRYCSPMRRQLSSFLFWPAYREDAGRVG